MTKENIEKTIKKREKLNESQSYNKIILSTNLNRRKSKIEGSNSYIVVTGKRKLFAK